MLAGIAVHPSVFDGASEGTPVGCLAGGSRSTPSLGPSSGRPRSFAAPSPRQPARWTTVDTEITTPTRIERCAGARVV